MLSRCYFILLIIITMADLSAQEELPLKEIPPAPEQYTETTVMARMVEGLGYRYFWATEGLTANELSYRPTKEARSVEETLDHLLGLSETIRNACLAKANIRPMQLEAMDFGQKRKQTLAYLSEASQLLRKAKSGEMDEFSVIFKRGEKEFSFPYWNMINGPIADAIYHVGQIVSFRRTAGNPMNPKVNVFMGKTGN